MAMSSSSSSSRTYNPGALIGDKYESFCIIPLKTMRGTHCNYCFRQWPNYAMIYCEKCYSACYCSATCKRLHGMYHHGTECKNSLYRYCTQMGKTDLHWEIVLLHFAIQMFGNKTASTKDEDDPRTYRKFNLLDGTKRSFWELPQDPKWKEDEALVRVCEDMNNYMSQRMRVKLTPDHFLEMYTIFRSNCLPFVVNGVHAGYIFFPEISGILHSCRPNAHWRLEDLWLNRWRLQIRAIETISSETKPTISYVTFDYEDIEKLKDLPRVLKRECDDQCDRCNWAMSNQHRYRAMQQNHRVLTSYIKARTRPWKATWARVKPMHDNIMEILRLLFGENDRPITMHLVAMTKLAKRFFERAVYEDLKKMANDRIAVMAGVDSDVYRSIN